MAQLGIKAGLDTEAIAREYGPYITSICRRMIWDQELARDTAQDIWLEIVKSLGSFNGRSSFSTWMYSIARRTISRTLKKDYLLDTRRLSMYFKSKDESGLPEMMEIPQEDHTAWIKLQCSDCINAMLHCLDTESRLIYLLRKLTELSYGEIAQIVGKREDVVRQSFSRGSRKITRFLDGNCSLYNSGGDCRCKMRKPIEEKTKKKEFDGIREFSKKLMFMKNMDIYASLEKNWISVVTNPSEVSTN
ncbi:MAG: RNA polymerase sigma factor [Spirochaetales bacterium]|nr:RNA polymerase sigma factor [Spirochaetales bacterium]